MHRRVVAGHLSGDAIHDVEGHAQDRRVRFEPTNARHGHVRVFEHLQHSDLKRDVVGREDDILFRLKPCDQSLPVILAVFAVDEIEEERVAREARSERGVHVLDADVTGR